MLTQESSLLDSGDEVESGLKELKIEDINCDIDDNSEKEESLENVDGHENEQGW